MKGLKTPHCFSFMTRAQILNALFMKTLFIISMLICQLELSLKRSTVSFQKKEAAFEKWLFLNSTRSCCECFWIEKSNFFPSVRRFFVLVSYYRASSLGKWERMKEKTMKSLRVKLFNNKKVNEDNGKSNFCITKHFTLCVLQAKTRILRCCESKKEGVRGKGRRKKDVFWPEGPSKWNS